MNRRAIALFAGLAAFASLGLTAFQTAPLSDAQKFISEYDSTIRPVEIASAKAYWAASISGSEADYKAKESLETKLDTLLSDPARYARLEKMRKDLASTIVNASAAKPVSYPDSLVVREIELLHLESLSRQVDPTLLAQMNTKSNAVEKAFNTYRPKVDGREMTDSEVNKVLKESKDSAVRQKVWEASKGVGSVVLPDFKELVKLRNEAARKLNFKNYYDMQLQLGEQTPAQVIKLFDELYDLTREPFAAAKAEIDTSLAAACGIKVSELRPWHYHDRFFQDPPAADGFDLDAVYAQSDVPKLTGEFYAGLGLPIDATLARSDLYEKPGKDPHAFCTDIDREGDVRMLANLVPNEDSMGTAMHELGHSVYMAPNVPMSLPYILRTDAHTLATEGFAMMFGSFPLRANWMQSMHLPVADPAAAERTGAKMRRNQLLIFAAWTQVMVRFESAMYDNPDQDLNKLWWDLVEKYQLIHRPNNRNAPDYAAKYHICLAPAYYHNYLIGQLFACQLEHAIDRDVLKTDPKTGLFTGRKDVGDYIKSHVFAYGRSLRWDAFVKAATGEELSARAFAEDVR